jgi:TorA maturation chaperone TorD
MTETESGWCDLAGAYLYPEEQPEGGPELGALQTEYVRLFVNAVPTVPCPPYASFYLEGTLMGRAKVEVEWLYGGYGFEPEPAMAGDHIAVELEFAGVLAALSAEDSAASQDLERLLGHMRRWAPTFLARVEAQDRTGYYARAARRTREAICGAEATAPAAL